MEEVDFPNTLLELDEGAFKDCENLKKVRIPEKVETISKGAFYNTKFFEKCKEKEKMTGKCCYCGGDIKGILSKKCTSYGKDSVFANKAYKM